MLASSSFSFSTVVGSSAVLRLPLLQLLCACYLLAVSPPRRLFVVPVASFVSRDLPRRRRGRGLADQGRPRRFEGAAAATVLTATATAAEDDDDDDDETSIAAIGRRPNDDPVATVTRREVLAASAGVAAAAAGCCCCCCLSPEPAAALATIAPLSSSSSYDLPRDARRDAAFARGMAVGMGDYERAAKPGKERLFRTLMDHLEPIPEPVVVEVGIGSFPNAPYYRERFAGAGGLDLVGVDPNDTMEGYARTSAVRAGLHANDDSVGDGDTEEKTTKRKRKNTLRIVHGVSEALPFEDGACDAVVCSLTLCSVEDPVRSVAEIRRILKPGGAFLFWEHVLSETDPSFALRQKLATPMQVKAADGCHLDRTTGATIRAAGFRSVDSEYLELNGFGFLNPTACGIATA